MAAGERFGEGADGVWEALTGVSEVGESGAVNSGRVTGRSSRARESSISSSDDHTMVKEAGGKTEEEGVHQTERDMKKREQEA